MSSPWIFSRLKMLGSKPSDAPTKDENPLRIGILGAASIAPPAVIQPAHYMSDVQVLGIAARDETKGKAFAQKHGIPKTYESYEKLLEDPEIDAVYIPAPNSLHHKWCLAALRAGKHVLCEKPLASNADEAQEIVEETQKSGKILMEAFHYRYHPLTLRLKEILESGEIGDIKGAEVKMLIPGVSFKPDDIRFNLSLAGGALMDCGCYAINVLRYIMGSEPSECTMSKITPSPNVCGLPNESLKNEVDGTTHAEFSFPNGATGSIECSLVGTLFTTSLVPSLQITGTKGSIKLTNFVLPSIYHSLTVSNEGKTRVEKHYQDGQSTYYHQLRAFAAAVREGRPFPTTPEDGVKNMKVIDSVYRKAGLTPRGKFTPQE